MLQKCYKYFGNVTDGYGIVLILAGLLYEEKKVKQEQFKKAFKI